MNKIRNRYDIEQSLGLMAASLTAAPASSVLTHAPAANTAAVVTLAAETGLSQGLRGVAWSYEATPAGGNLKVEDDNITVFSVDITAAGPGFLPLCLRSSPGKLLRVTLSAGGSGVSGKVNVLQHWAE